MIRKPHAMRQGRGRHGTGHQTRHSAARGASSRVHVPPATRAGRDPAAPGTPGEGGSRTPTDDA